MKETKITKRIFAVFVAFIVILLISCGDLQVFADNLSFSLVWSVDSSGPDGTFFVVEHSNGESFSSSKSGFFGSWNYTCHFPTVDYFRVRFRMYYNGTNHYCTSAYIGTYLLSTSVDSPTVIDFTDPLTIRFYGNSTTSTNFYFSLVSVPTPTPEPTPTPVPTPTPEPTFNPDQPTYTTFFNHLLNDGNNALNALYLSWTQANNKFYTGIFFIGLPIMIGIFGIVASIFFGGDD